MPKWTFSEKEDLGPISFSQWDYGCGVIIGFSFPSAYVSLGIPKDITAESMADALEDVAKKLRQKGRGFYLPVQYAKDRVEYIKRVQEAEAEDA